MASVAAASERARPECGDDGRTVEVCLGPDCSGGGGGAALLEIEDLASKLVSDDGAGGLIVRVIDGGCRDRCTVGPNVYVRGADGDHHFTRVNSPEECRRVMRAVARDGGVAREEPSGVERILLLREDGRRWRALRERAAAERRLRVRERASKNGATSTMNSSNHGCK